MSTVPVDDMVPVLRCLEVGHASAMSALERQCFSLPWSEEQCRAAFAQRAFAALGLWVGPALRAYLSVYHTAGELEILNLAVSPELRRQGLGHRLLRAVLRLAAKAGIVKVLLEVRAGNTPAVSLYQSCGFQRVGLRKGYYADTGEDAHIYMLEIQSASRQPERSA